MSGGDQLTPPPCVWAQKSKVILLTICLEDCKKPEIQIHKDKIYFKGVGGTDKKAHEVTINLYKEINPEESLHNVRDRNIELVLKKATDGPFWSRLTQEKIKYHWLKFDFNKWDEEGVVNDDYEGETPNWDLEEALKKMGGLESNYDSDDSDTADLPDLW
ncbi:hypothetical protein RUM44_002015 [Polyplax serrata]|uniref:CS domain-containing protein n=1 Tax=Polyplax serrata TaxID=468196 RepID=A0ABR1ALP2_POLSC